MGEEYRTGNSFGGTLNKATQRSETGLRRRETSPTSKRKAGRADLVNVCHFSTQEGEIKGLPIQGQPK